MSNLTKEQLKNALISHGIKLPSPSAKKNAYIKLYLHNVAPNDIKSEFSSDEESNYSPSTTSKEIMSSRGGFVVNGLDVTSLDDEELFSRLQDLGATVGPVVDSTRRIYQKNLVRLMGGDVVDSQYNDEVDLDEEEVEDDEGEYSDNDVLEPLNVSDMTPPKVNLKTTEVTTTVTTSTSYDAELRKRLVSHEDAFPHIPLQYDADLHTPSPRPSLRTVVGTPASSYLSSPRQSFGMSCTKEQSCMSVSPQNCCMMRMLVKLAIFALMFVALYYAYQNYYSESPFVGIEHLARQALEGMDLQEDLKKDSSD